MDNEEKNNDKKPHEDTTVDLKDLEFSEEFNKEEKEPLSWIEWIYIFSVESLSCADIVTDVLILNQLIKNTHLWWTTWSVLFIISPYLVSYTAMGTMQQKKSVKLSVIVMTPLCIIYFLTLDIVFMVYAVFSSFIFLLTLSKVNIGDWMEIQFFRRFLGISRMELIGYRRLRTLSQLLFESFPSIVLQLRMLYVLGNETNDEKVDVSYQSLYFSLLFALLHTLMEGCILYLDSKVGVFLCILNSFVFEYPCTTTLKKQQQTQQKHHQQACFLSLEEYAIICLNARLSWVPFTNILSMAGAIIEKVKVQPVKGNKLINSHRILDFEHITSDFCGAKYKLDFEFGKDSWQIFIKYINNINAFSPNTITIIIMVLKVMACMLKVY